MKTTVSLYDFRDAFQRMGRGNNFTYEGLEALFEYLEEYESDTGEEMELDVIALCCDFEEYTTAELISEFSEDEDDDENDDEDKKAERIADELRDKTTVIEVSNGNYIVGEF